MADYFGSDPKGRLLEDIAELRQNFLLWQERVRHWDEMIYPHIPNSGSLGTFSRTDTKLNDKTGAREDTSGSHYITAIVRQFVDAYVNRMSRSSPYIEFPDEGLDRNESEKESNGERFCYGVLNSLDAQVIAKRMGTGWLRQLYSFSANPGKMIGRIHVREAVQGSGLACIDWELFDPISCYHDFDETPSRFVREWIAPASTLLRLAWANGWAHNSAALNKLSQMGRKPCLAQEYWLEDMQSNGKFLVHNGIMAAGEILKSPLEPTKFKHSPLVIISTNTMARTYQQIDRGAVSGNSDQANPNTGVAANYILRHAEPPFAALEHIVSQLQEAKSIEMDAAYRSIHPVSMIRSPDGTWMVGKQLETPGAQIPMLPEYEIKVLETIGNFIGVESTSNDLKAEIRRTIPDDLFGQAAFAGEPGYLYNRRSEDSALTALAESANGVSQFLKIGLQEVISQFKDSGLKISLEGRSTKGEDAGKWWTRDFDSADDKDIPRTTAIYVRTAPELPRDDFKAMQMYKMATEGPDPAVDKATARAKYLMVSDPYQMQKRIDRELADKSVRSSMRRTVEAKYQEMQELHTRLKAEKSAPKRQELQRQILSLWEDIKADEGDMMGNQNQRSAQFPVQGAPPPETQPGAERGFESPSEEAALSGTAPTGTTGSPAAARRNGKSPNGKAGKR